MTLPQLSHEPATRPPPSGGGPRSRRDLLGWSGLVLLVVLAGLARGYAAGEWDLTASEWRLLTEAQASWAEVRRGEWWRLAAEPMLVYEHLPLAGGRGAFDVAGPARISSLLWGLATIPLFFSFFFGRLRRVEAFGSSILVLCSPLLIHFAQSATSHAAAFFLSAASILSFLRGVERSSGRWLAVAAGTWLGALACHPSALGLIPSYGAIACLSRTGGVALREKVGLTLGVGVAVTLALSLVARKVGAGWGARAEDLVALSGPGPLPVFTALRNLLGWHVWVLAVAFGLACLREAGGRQSGLAVAVLSASSGVVLAPWWTGGSMDSGVCLLAVVFVGAGLSAGAVGGLLAASGRLPALAFWTLLALLFAPGLASYYEGGAREPFGEAVERLEGRDVRVLASDEPGLVGFHAAREVRDVESFYEEWRERERPVPGANWLILSSSGIARMEWAHPGFARWLSREFLEIEAIRSRRYDDLVFAVSIYQGGKQFRRLR